MKKISLSFIVDNLTELGWDYSCGRMSRSGMEIYDGIMRHIGIIEEYDKSQFDEEPTTLMDIPKDWEGSSISIGDCLLDLQTHINELYNYFSEEAE